MFGSVKRVLDLDVGSMLFQQTTLGARYRIKRDQARSNKGGEG